MNRSIFTAFLLGIICSGAFINLTSAQDNAQKLFDEGNEHLKEAEYERALEQYKKIDTLAYTSGALFLNMGIAYMNMDSLGIAKYYFLKATEFNATRTKAEEAVIYINTQFSRQSVRLPKLPWQVAFDWLNKHLGATLVLFIGLTLLNTGIIIFIFRWFVNIIPRALKIAGISTSVLGMCVIILSFYLWHLDQRYTLAVQVNEQTAVYEKPEASSAVVSQSYEGYDFTVDYQKTGENEEWIYVRMSNGQYGWIPKRDIRIL